MPRKVTFIIECTPAARMAAMVGAPIRETRKGRRVTFITEVPQLISNRRTDDYQCGSKPKAPKWLTSPEDYRCILCRRYCNDAFLVQGKCGYCRGEW